MNFEYDHSPSLILKWKYRTAGAAYSPVTKNKSKSLINEFPISCALISPEKV